MEVELENWLLALGPTFPFPPPPIHTHASSLSLEAEDEAIWARSSKGGGRLAEKRADGRSCCRFVQWGTDSGAPRFAGKNNAYTGRASEHCIPIEGTLVCSFVVFWGGGGKRASRMKKPGQKNLKKSAHVSRSVGGIEGHVPTLLQYIAQSYL